MPDLKIIIPMAGMGKRLLPLTEHRPKALVRIADGRLIDHVLETFQILENAYRVEFVFIIGYLGEQIKAYMEETHPDKNVTYYVQERLIGQSDAIYLARERISGPLLLTYCDTINDIDFSFLSSEAIDGVAAVREVADPRSHGVAVVGSDNLVSKLIEKPDSTENKLALTGVYYLSEGEKLIGAIETQFQRGMTKNGEYYLADAINILVEGGLRIKTEKVLQWLDAGTPATILETNAYLLQRHSKFWQEDVTESGNIFRPPVHVHDSSHIENSIVGPNVAIGENCSISGSILRNSIVDDGSTLTDVALLNSLIGKYCSLEGQPSEFTLADQDSIRIYNTFDKMTTIRENDV